MTHPGRERGGDRQLKPDRSSGRDVLSHNTIRTDSPTMDERGAKLRLVTFLTFVRFPLVLLFFAGAIVYAFHDLPWLFVLSFAALILGAVTDLFDGLLARRFGVETRFGAHADPLMDKLFYLTTLPLLVFVATKDGHMVHGTFLLAMTVLFLARDQWVTFLRSIGSMYDVSGSANWSGKLRTLLNFPLICAIYYVEEAPTPFIDVRLVALFEGLAWVLNGVSAYSYTRHYWPYLHLSAALDPKPAGADKGHADDKMKVTPASDHGQAR